MTDWEVLESMQMRGGLFVRTLATLCHRADPENLAKIKATWPEYWAEYAEMARFVKDRDAATR